MQIQIACPNCSKAYSLPSDFNGKKVKCKKCGKIFRVEINKLKLEFSNNIQIKPIPLAKSLSVKSKNDANEGVEAFSINTSPTAQSPLPSTFKTCPLCGEEVKLVAIKCKHCGGSTKSKQEIASQQAAFAALFLVVIVMFGGFWAAKSYSEGLREEAEAMGRHSENLIRRMEGKPPIKY